MLSEIRGIDLTICSLFEADDALMSACQLELDRLEDVLTGGSFRTMKRVPEPRRLVQLHISIDSLKGKVRESRRKLKPRWFSI